jgi:hypothetical protein
VLVGERADERGLPDPGLAADEDQPSVAARSGSEMLAESGEISPALDEFHRWMVRRFAKNEKARGARFLRSSPDRRRRSDCGR